MINPVKTALSLKKTAYAFCKSLELTVYKQVLDRIVIYHLVSRYNNILNKIHLEVFTEDFTNMLRHRVFTGPHCESEHLQNIFIIYFISNQG